MQRSIAVVLLFMFWNGFTDIFWMAPTLLFDPLLLCLWIFLVLLYRKDLKDQPFIWLLGGAVFINNLLHFSHFSNFHFRTIDLQQQETSYVAMVLPMLAIILTFIAWGMMLWKLTKEHTNRNNWRLLFGVFFLVDLIFCPPASAPFFNGILVLIFILRTKNRQPFFWFLMAQFVSVCLIVFEMILWLFSFAPGGKN